MYQVCLKEIESIWVPDEIFKKRSYLFYLFLPLKSFAFLGGVEGG